MQKGRLLRVTSALAVGSVATSYKVQDIKCQTIKDYYDKVKNNNWRIPLLVFPKVYALKVHEVEKSRQLSKQLSYQYNTLKSITSFGDFENEKVNEENRLEYSDFLVYYDPERKNPLFAYEYITEKSIAKKGRSLDKFFWLPDDRIKTNQYFTPTDELDKAHMAARENHTKSELDEAQTYFLTNASPQNKILNQTIWKELEIFTRMLTEDDEYEGVHIFTGPAWDKGPKSKIEGTDIQIPSHFFKILIIENKTDPDMEKHLDDFSLFCFLVPNKKAPKKGKKQFYQYIGRYIATLDEVDKMTQLGFKRTAKDLEWLPFK